MWVFWTQKSGKDTPNFSFQMFTAGRYEYRNKGVDMFIESLARKFVCNDCNAQ